MDTEDLIQAQLKLECIKIIEEGLLERIPCLNPDDIGLLYVYRIGEKYLVYIRSDVSQELREHFRDIPAKDLFHHKILAQTIFEKEGIRLAVYEFQTYQFPRTIVNEQVQEVIRIENDQRQAFCIFESGKEASSCISVRENEQASECYVFTDEKYRRRGYARKTVLAWAQYIQGLGKIPFYSHEVDNLASRAVAQKLGLAQSFSVVVYSDE